MKVVVLGGGLTGLSTAYHLGGDVPVYERDPAPGGVARSAVIKGYIFDHTGHLLHFKDPRVAALLDQLTPGLFKKWDRRASVWIAGVKTDYPFQVNTFGHPPEMVADCLAGFETAFAANRDAKDGSFKDWILATFGSGFARHFFFPYNEKFWRRDLGEVTADWVAWAIPRPSLEAVSEGARGVVKQGLGYNPAFSYPRSGGIGQLADGLAAKVPGLHCGRAAVAVDTTARVVTLAGGEQVGYDHLVSTLPLTALVAMSDLPDALKQAAKSLRWVGVLNFNVGLRRERAWEDHWTYFPDPELPFYRVGVPTNFSQGIAPPGTTSLYVEVTYRPEQEPDPDALWPSVLAGLQSAGVVRDPAEVDIVHVIRIPHAYVVFDEDRKRVLPELLAALAARGVRSIGRYGAWEYSSMEKALVDGMDAATAIGRES